MSAEENKATVHRLVEEILNKGDLDALDQYIAEEAVEHSLPPGLPPNREGFKMFFSGFRAAFPDLHYHIQDEIAEGDKVMQRVIGHGTMQGEFQGMAPTGKEGKWSEMHLVRMAGGKIVEHWATVDQLGMMVAVGLMPPPGG
jgi:predicted ester cyclase